MNGFILSCIIMLGNISVAYEMDKSKIVKRQTDEIKVYTVELLIVVDFTVHQYWRTQTQVSNAIKNEEEVDKIIISHYKSVVKGINTRFSSVDNLIFAIDVVISDVIILKNRSEAVWVGPNQTDQSLDATQTLSSFRKWKQMTSDLPVHDHAMLFTRYDLTKDGSESVAGLAYTGTMCTGTSLSIVEDLMTSQSVTVASHELAHSLGARHDGSNNRCSSRDNFIMTEVTSVTGDLQKNRNSWRFSECSSEYFSEYIARLDNRRINCLVNRPVANDSSTSYDDVTPKVSETVASPDQQCERIQGDNSRLCRNLYRESYTDFCALMYCSVDDVTCNFRLPLDGTTCGHNKICKAGYCVFPNAVVRNTSVTFSDDDDDGMGLTTSLGSYGLRYTVVRLDSTLNASRQILSAMMVFPSLSGCGMVLGEEENGVEGGVVAGGRRAAHLVTKRPFMSAVVGGLAGNCLVAFIPDFFGLTAVKALLGPWHYAFIYYMHIII